MRSLLQGADFSCAAATTPHAGSPTLVRLTLLLPCHVQGHGRCNPQEGSRAEVGNTRRSTFLNLREVPQACHTHDVSACRVRVCIRSFPAIQPPAASGRFELHATAPIYARWRALTTLSVLVSMACTRIVAVWHGRAVACGPTPESRIECRKQNPLDMCILLTNAHPERYCAA